MRQIILIVFIGLNLWSCKRVNDSTISESMTSNSTGVAVIQGRIGYFSEAIPPPNSPRTFLYPSGYQLGEYRWITADTPNVANRIYIVGDYSQFKNRYVQIKGTWSEVVKIQDSKEYRYIEISVNYVQKIQ